MRVIEVQGLQARKISKKKAILSVKTISPPSLKDVHIQLFCISLNQTPRRGKVPTLASEQLSKSGAPSAKLLF